MDSVLQNSEAGVRRLAGGWLLLAVTALAFSTLCAVLLVAARVPLPGVFAGAGDLFGRALVLHVSLAVVVWFLACAAGIWMIAGGAAGVVRWAALSLAGAGVAAMLLPLFSQSAQPVLANYVPVLEHPVFLAGLVLFLAGVVLAGASAAYGVFRKLRAEPAAVWRLGVLLSTFAAAAALAAFIASFIRTGIPAGPVAFEVLAWAPGHALQFVHVLLLMSVWIVLGERVLGQAVAPRHWVQGLLLLAALPLLAVPFIYINHPVDSASFRRGFTLLMAWGVWPAAALLALRILLQLTRAGRAILAVPQAPALLLSILLFLLGCVLGALIRGDSTMVPAHYHGTVGAVTLAYMAFGYRLLPAFGWDAGNSAWVRRQPVLYGAGLAILALALAWSGWLGVPRKTLHVDVIAQIVQFPAYYAAMGLAGLGGLLAISGAVLFVVNVVAGLRAVHRAGRRAEGRIGPRDVRMQAILVTAALTVVIGVLIAWWPSEFGQQVAAPTGKSAVPKDKIAGAAAHVVQKRKEEIARQFAEGVAMLNARDYNAAASALHRVLELEPQMPEAHVNMGFAMIGLKKYEMARDFFEVAINLRTAQMNAYYGLAVALEKTGDLEGALGAMRTYVHRSNPEDPFVRKANAAIWEWESVLAETRKTKNQKTASIPESRNGVIRYPIPEKRLN
ncbi:MAG TPA: cbb3-type cytochrome c oxidase subunit I [Noviherbaspirillum sp.]|nr:cbb3-type cytochrome c oxidase subunit I [Noviherbaspirillum sp.]